MSDLISREMLLEYIHNEPVGKLLCDKYNLDGVIKQFPAAQPEQLTDKEQRIFLAAMGREEKVCKQVDDECRNCREPYDDSLVRACHEITRKVKGALWTYFETNEKTVDYTYWERLVKAGLADKEVDGENIWYSVTRSGMDWLGQHDGIHIYDEED